METWEYEKLKHSLVEKGEAMKRQKGWMGIDQQFAAEIAQIWKKEVPAIVGKDAGGKQDNSS